MMFDADQFEERAAIMEYDGGLSRFEAEIQAAKLQGRNRWQALEGVRDANGMGNSGTAPNQREAAIGYGSGDLPGMQPRPEKQA